MVPVMMMMAVMVMAVVVMMMPPVVMVVMVPAPVMHLFGARHAVSRRPQAGRRQWHCGCDLWRGQSDRQPGERHQNEFAHVTPP
jgi:hypothetical protein